jgi:NitT/TauT family transport system substrate-binding protein
VRIAVPDLISPSYFPAIAAVDLGLAREEGLDLELDLLFPVTDAAAALRDGKIGFLAGAAHAPLYAVAGWRGVKLVAALSQNTYWFLVLRSDLAAAAQGDLSCLRGLRIGAAPGPDACLRVLLEDAGLGPDGGDVRIGPVPGGSRSGISFGVAAADALAAGRVDGFWANGMGAEVAVRTGTGTVVLDARRGDGPAAASSYTFPALMATDEMIAEQPGAVAAAVRAVMRAQRILAEEPERARETGERLFPPMEADLIAGLIRRDGPYYDPAISGETVQSLNAFARRAGLLEGPAPYGDVVSDSGRSCWGGPG